MAGNKIFVQIVFIHSSLSLETVCPCGVWLKGSLACLREERSDTVGSLQVPLGPREPFQAEDGRLFRDPVSSCKGRVDCGGETSAGRSRRDLCSPGSLPPCTREAELSLPLSGSWGFSTLAPDWNYRLKYCLLGICQILV